MLIAKILDGQVVQVAEHLAMFPDTSFSTNGPNEDFLIKNGCLHVNLWKPYDKKTEQLVNCSPYIENNQVFLVEVQKLPEQIVINEIE